jgi:hypothetical protein
MAMRRVPSLIACILICDLYFNPNYTGCCRAMSAAFALAASPQLAMKLGVGSRMWGRAGGASQRAMM